MYGELRDCKRSAGKLRKRFKDCLKDSLKKACVNTQVWEKKEKCRNGWKAEIVQAVKDFGERRIENEEVKRAVRHNEEVTPPPRKGF